MLCVVMNTPDFGKSSAIRFLTPKRFRLSMRSGFLGMNCSLGKDFLLHLSGTHSATERPISVREKSRHGLAGYLVPGMMLQRIVFWLMDMPSRMQMSATLPYYSSTCKRLESNALFAGTS